MPAIQTKISFWPLLLAVVLNVGEVVSKWDGMDSCGKGGRSDGSIPSYVSIKASETNKTGGCGGALISNQYIITTGERAIRSQTNKRVYSSTNKYLGDISRVCTGHSTRREADLEKHVNIGILKLDKNVEMNDEVQSICLEPRYIKVSSRDYFMVLRDAQSGNQTVYRVPDNFMRHILSDGQVCEGDQGALVVDTLDQHRLVGLVLGPNSSDGTCSRGFRAVRKLEDGFIDQARALMKKCESR